MDDRTDTVGKKIRSGEQEWIPYLAVVGERESASGGLSIRMREDKSQVEMTAEELISLVRSKTEGMPFRPLPLPELISRRPVFYG